MVTSHLEKCIGYCFRNPALLENALTHRSYSNEQAAPPPCNERLEFLGDAVLDLVVGECLFLDFPALPEGELTRLRAELVNEQTLAAAARRLDLGVWLRLGRGEERSGGRDKESLLANALEALIGASFRDGGWEAARSLCLRLLEEPMAHLQADGAGRDYKTRLQEYLQTNQGRLPIYVLVSTSGPDHARVFAVEVRIGEKMLGRGEGRTKKAAEQEAAARALVLLESEPVSPTRSTVTNNREQS